MLRHGTGIPRPRSSARCGHWWVPFDCGPLPGSLSGGTVCIWGAWVQSHLTRSQSVWMALACGPTPGEWKARFLRSHLVLLTRHRGGRGQPSWSLHCLLPLPASVRTLTSSRPHVPLLQGDPAARRPLRPAGLRHWPPPGRCWRRDRSLGCVLLTSSTNHWGTWRI